MIIRSNSIFHKPIMISLLKQRCWNCGAGNSMTMTLYPNKDYIDTWFNEKGIPYPRWCERCQQDFYYDFKILPYKDLRKISNTIRKRFGVKASGHDLSFEDVIIGRYLLPQLRKQELERDIQNHKGRYYFDFNTTLGRGQAVQPISI